MENFLEGVDLADERWLALSKMDSLETRAVQNKI